ncbi:amino acid-binding protein [Aeromonas media]|uniref:amino acid-binding protein n=1 Tax=Aeromonas media TaxID=651 RepID=UPI00192504F0|nr:amino acid-binding protein [Aeromonas media]MBL0515240.1 amino acid-binding protein [Aeromonas media]
MYDIHVMLPDNPGTLGLFGSLMGRVGVSLEGGGMFTLGGAGHAHFLVEDGTAAARAAEQGGLEVVAVREVLVRRLKQEMPGQLGAICSALREASVNIITLYSDHANQLILVTDDIDKARRVTAEWQ